MPTTGATGYDTLTGAGYPSATVTDFTLYVSATMSAAWQAAFTAAGANTGTIRVTDALGTELPRDILSYSSGVLAMRVLWSGARGLGDYPALRVYPDATGSYAVTDTYGGRAAYSGWLLHYPFIEGSGTSLGNRCSVNYQGSIAGASWQSGTMGPELAFSSINHYVDTGFIPGSAAGFSLRNMTLVLWVATTSTATGEEYAAGVEENTPAANSIQLGRFSNIVYGPIRGNGVTCSMSASGQSINNGVPHFLVVTMDSVSGGKIFTDGIQRQSNATVVGEYQGVTRSLFLGCRNKGTRGEAWPGTIQRAQLHSLARSAEWIAYEYGITSNPAAFWTDSGWTSAGTPWWTYYSPRIFFASQEC